MVLGDSLRAKICAKLYTTKNELELIALKKRRPSPAAVLVISVERSVLSSGSGFNARGAETYGSECAAANERLTEVSLRLSEQ
jgi:hypothetical protein